MGYHFERIGKANGVENAPSLGNEGEILILKKWIG